MNNYNIMYARQTQPDWLKKVMEESESERALHAYMDSGMFKQKPRRIVWYACEKLNCCTHGVPGEACRLAEWFIVYTIKRLPPQEGSESVIRKTLEYFRPRMLLILISSILIAAEVNAAKLTVTAQDARSFLASEGFIYQLENFISMRSKIMKTIEFNDSPKSCVQLGEMLARELRVASHIVSLVANIINLAEKYMYDIETALHLSHFIRSQNGPRMRVRTLHLAAAGVAAAIKYASPREDATSRLAYMLNLSVEYMECVSDIVLKETTKLRVAVDNPLAELHHRMSFNDNNNSKPRPRTHHRMHLRKSIFKM